MKDSCWLSCPGIRSYLSVCLFSFLMFSSCRNQRTRTHLYNDSDSLPLDKNDSSYDLICWKEELTLVDFLTFCANITMRSCKSGLHSILLVFPMASGPNFLCWQNARVYLSSTMVHWQPVFSHYNWCLTKKNSFCYWEHPAVGKILIQASCPLNVVPK